MVRSICSASFIWAILAPAAFAAPFCLTNPAIPPQCMYYDAHQCQQDATKQGGYCVPNPVEQHGGVGSGQYCMMTSVGVTLCNFMSRESCAQEALRQHGACFHDETRETTGAPDPYAYYTNPPSQAGQ
jgi:hypothetical protein